MPELNETMVVFHRIDASKNMARFYAMNTQPTLFGEVTLLRNWGRIGTNGQVLMMTFKDAPAANLALSRLALTKGRKGYERRPL